MKMFILISIIAIFLIIAVYWRKIQHQFKMNIKEYYEQDNLIGMNLASIKAAYGDKFYQLRNIINDHDPYGLLRDEAPEDEYEPEVKTIIVQLDNKVSVEEIQELVYNEFDRWFGDAGPKQAYLDLAKDIYNWKSNK